MTLPAVRLEPRQALPALLAMALALAAAPLAAQTAYTNLLTADAFVRAALPTSNFGGAGAVSVSGATATNASGVVNGVHDTFLRLNTAAMVGSLDAQYGVNGWDITSVTLRVNEQGTPNQATFNRGAGLFEIRWIAADAWTEGVGTPGFPAMTGVTFNDEPSLLDAMSDVTLGTFASAGADGVLSFSLALPTAFLDDLRAGGDVSLFLTAVSPDIGFTFTSRSGGNLPRPELVVTAVPEPGAWALLALAGAGGWMLRRARRSAVRTGR